MKIERVPALPPPTPPDEVVITFSLEEAGCLKRLCNDHRPDTPMLTREFKAELWMHLDALSTTMRYSGA